MPVTARLSRRFYEKMGDEATAEMLSGDAALRAELHSELRMQLRWMFGFWATTLLAIAGLKLL